MITQLLQKRGFNHRKHFLYADKVVVETKTPTKKSKYEVKIDQIGFDIHYQADNTISKKLAIIFFIALPIAFTIINFFVKEKMDLNLLIVNYVICYFVALLMYLSKGQDDIFLTGGYQNLVFYRTIPEEKAVLEFIHQVMSTKKQYMTSRYTVFDQYTGEEEFMNRLRWLLDLTIITTKQYDDIRHDFKIKQLL